MDPTKYIDPLTKLIDVVSKGCGRLANPFLRRLEANASAHEIKRISQAINETNLLVEKIEYKDGSVSITSTEEQTQPITPEKSFWERTLARFAYQEQKKQMHLDAICNHAADELQSKESVSAVEVDEEWIWRFFRIAEDISSDQMQILWGKILAGEVNKPSSYSLRTLETLRNFTARDAVVFNKVAQAVISDTNSPFIPEPVFYDYVESEFGITYTDILLLCELGLLAARDHTLEFDFSDPEARLWFRHGDSLLTVKKAIGSPLLSLNVRLLTEIGKELLPLLKINARMSYFRRFARSVVAVGEYAEIARIVKEADDGDEVADKEVL